MSRPWQIGTVFGAGLAVVLAAVGWLTVTVVRLDRAEAAARQQAAVEENVRLALWRADSALAPLVARESGQPYFVYSSFYPARRAYARMFNALERGDVLVPSPLLTSGSPQILLHFQIADDGACSSPQVPPENLRGLAVPQFASAEQVAQAAERLNELRTRVDRAALLAALPLEPPRHVAAVAVTALWVSAE